MAPKPSYHASDSDGDLVDVSVVAPSVKSPPANMTVLGVFAKAPIPRRDELPEKFKVTQLKKDQIMVRRRLRTKPLFDDSQGEEKKCEDGDEEYERALFIKGHGLVGSTFFHADPKEHPGRPIYDERAVLFQSVEHYDSVLQSDVSSYILPEKLDGCTSLLADPTKLELVLDDPQFGENVLVRGIDSSRISVGDVFEVEGRLSPLKLEVSSPRLPCAFLDRKHGAPFGLKGTKRHCMTNALGGWFTRVLVPGDLTDGMTLVRTAHPYPKYTLTYLSKILYSEGNTRQLARGTAHWVRSIDELRELIDFEPLAEYEWKEEARTLLEELLEESDSDSDSDDDEPIKARSPDTPVSSPTKGFTCLPGTVTEETTGDDDGFMGRFSAGWKTALDACCTAPSLLFYSDPEEEGQ